MWLDVFSGLERNVIINFENGRRVYGWPEYYSVDGTEPYIYLHGPAWIDGEKFIDLDVEGILMMPTQKIESIEVLTQ